MSAAHFLEEKIRRLSTGNRTVNESSLYESYLIEEEEDEGEKTESAEAMEGQETADGKKKVKECHTS